MCHRIVTACGSQAMEDCVVSELSAADLVEVLLDRSAREEGLERVPESDLILLISALRAERVARIPFEAECV